MVCWFANALYCKAAGAAEPHFTKALNSSRSFSWPVLCQLNQASIAGSHRVEGMPVHDTAQLQEQSC